VGGVVQDLVGSEAMLGRELGFEEFPQKTMRNLC